MALPSGDTFITNVLIDLPWLFIFQSSIKPLVWCWRHSRNIQHKYTSLHNIFCSHVYLPVYATMQTSFLTCPAKQNDLEFCYLIHLQTKKKKKKKKMKNYVCVFWSKQNSNHNDIDESQYHSALQSTVTCPGHHIPTLLPESWWDIFYL